MGWFAFRQRRDISRNTGQIAGLLADQNSYLMTGKTVGQRQVEATDAEFQATVDLAVRKRCKRAGMPLDMTEAFIRLGTPERILWAQTHPEYKIGYDR